MSVNLEPRVALVGACQIHYLQAGAGKPVVFLHGAGGLRIDEQVFAALAERFRLLVPSMPGFDQSTPGSTTSRKDVADVMADFIRQEAGGKASVIGESFGGGVASWLAVRHPDAVDRLVLAAPAGLRQEGGPNLQELSPVEMNVLLFGKPPESQPSAEEIERRQRNRANVARLDRGKPAWDQELYDQLPQVKAPTLILWGTNDGMIFPQQGKHFNERIPGSKLIYIEGGPHVLSAATPAEFLEHTLEFMGVAETAAR